MTCLDECCGELAMYHPVPTFDLILVVMWTSAIYGTLDGTVCGISPGMFKDLNMLNGEVVPVAPVGRVGLEGVVQLVGALWFTWAQDCSCDGDGDGVESDCLYGV